MKKHRLVWILLGVLIFFTSASYSGQFKTNLVSSPKPRLIETLEELAEDEKLTPFWVVTSPCDAIIQTGISSAYREVRRRGLRKAYSYSHRDDRDPWLMNNLVAIVNTDESAQYNAVTCLRYGTWKPHPKRYVSQNPFEMATVNAIINDRAPADIKMIAKDVSYRLIENGLFREAQSRLIRYLLNARDPGGLSGCQYLVHVKSTFDRHHYSQLLLENFKKTLTVLVSALILTVICFSYEKISTVFISNH